jgi:hypothetical protein
MSNGYQIQKKTSERLANEVKQELATHFIRFDFLRQQKIEAIHWTKHKTNKSGKKTKLCTTTN